MATGFLDAICADHVRRWEIVETIVPWLRLESVPRISGWYKMRATDMASQSADSPMPEVHPQPARLLSVPRTSRINRCLESNFERGAQEMKRILLCLSLILLPVAESQACCLGRLASRLRLRAGIVRPVRIRQVQVIRVSRPVVVQRVVTCNGGVCPAR